MINEETKQTIERMSDIELQENLALGEDDFKPGVFDCYLIEAKKRNIGIGDIEKKEKENKAKSISGKRFINYLIDTSIGFYLPFFVLRPFVINAELNPFYALLATVIIYESYYLMLEVIFGKTIGKMITKTKIADIEGNEPEKSKLLVRNFSRLIPFNAWVALFTNISIHERISKTRTIIENESA